MDGKELLRGFSDVDDAIVEEMLKKRRLGLNTARRGGKGVIMRMIGYSGGYPSSGVSPLLMARLLRLSLKHCHKTESKK